MNKSIDLSITNSAASRIKHLLELKKESFLGIRVGVAQGGCSGLTYEVELAKEIRQGDEIIEDKGVKVVIDPAATLFLIGSTVDWVESKFESGFVFKNPNETSRCGCGESFSI